MPTQSDLFAGAAVTHRELDAMPDLPLFTNGKLTGFLSVGDDYKPGDQPPTGYGDWHEWAEVQDKAGLKSRKCDQCGLWNYPQEIASVVQEEQVAYLTRRDLENETNAVTSHVDVVTCNKCLEA